MQAEAQIEAVEPAGAEQAAEPRRRCMATGLAFVRIQQTRIADLQAALARRQRRRNTRANLANAPVVGVHSNPSVRSANDATNARVSSVDPSSTNSHSWRGLSAPPWHWAYCRRTSPRPARARRWRPARHAREELQAFGFALVGHAQHSPEALFHTDRRLPVQDLLHVADVGIA